MAQEILSRQLESFRRAWQPKLDAYAKAVDPEEAEFYHRSDCRDFEIELTNLVQAAFAAAQAPFAAELDSYRQCARDTRLLQSAQELVVRRGIDF